MDIELPNSVQRLSNGLLVVRHINFKPIFKLGPYHEYTFDKSS